MPDKDKTAQSIENLKATIAELDKLISVEQDRDRVQELQRLKAHLFKAIATLENK